jgi:hypothetical protein
MTKDKQVRSKETGTDGTRKSRLRRKKKSQCRRKRKEICSEINRYRARSLEQSCRWKCNGRRRKKKKEEERKEQC